MAAAPSPPVASPDGHLEDLEMAIRAPPSLRVPQVSLGPSPSVSAPIPTYRIDLSLPPSQRFVQLATDFAPKLQELTALFDLVLETFLYWAFVCRVAKFLSYVFLRRVRSAEETQEVKGIARASGVRLHVIVALNVLLDSLLGCTSGGVLAFPRDLRGERGRSARMLHFRTLDWGMDELRSLLVVLEFVRSKSDDPDKVIGTVITYAGFVGVLTGVRENLSISLNFRAQHACSYLALVIHKLLVLVGIRPSISSVLRRLFLQDTSCPSVVDDKAMSLVKTRSTPCYVIFSSSGKTIVVQKDLVRGVAHTAREFIVHTNHDFRSSTDATTPGQKENAKALGMQELLEESMARQGCMQEKWDDFLRTANRDARQSGAGGSLGVEEETLKEWVKSVPIMSDCTHFACILDPGTGTIRWLERGAELEGDSTRGDSAKEGQGGDRHAASRGQNHA